MITSRLLGCSVLSALLLSSCATVDSATRGGGASVQVSFQSPEKFTDMARTYATDRVPDPGYTQELRRYIERTAASRLPVNYTLSVTITDVDMAGDFEPQRGADLMDVRVVKSIYPPRINLTYRLTDPTGTLVSEGERRLRNQAFEWNASPIERDDPLRHEKALIDDFLRDVAQEVKS